MALAGSLVSLGTFVLIYGLLALGLNVKFGFNGLLDIGHVAFFLIGAYTAALLVLPPATVPTQKYATYILGLEWTWPAAVIVAMIVAGVAGMLVALPAIRLREDYLAITVLGISVIAKRTIQTETWLANGPSSLKGWSKPLRQMFPLPGGAESFDLTLFGMGYLDVTLFSVPTPVVLGVIVFGVWSMLVYLLARLLGEHESGARSLLVHGLFAVLTLGIGYAASRLARREETSPLLRYVFAGGLVAGVAATAMAFVGTSSTVPIPFVGPLDMHNFAVALFMGLASLLTWAIGALAITEYYAELTWREAGLGVALGLVFIAVVLPVAIFGGTAKEMGLALAVSGVLAVGFVAALYRLRNEWVAGVFAAPLVVVFAVALLVGGGNVEAMASIGLVLTVIFAVAFVTVLYYLGNDWEQYGTDGAFLSVLGVGTVTLFVVRYFLLPLVGPVRAGNLATAATDTVVNLVWLVQIGTDVALNYSRFRFLLFLFIVAGAYLVIERTVRSPFGRALKAVRDDEQVANALGKNAFRFKVQSMILGSALAGLAGALFALWFGALTHTSFQPKITFIALLIVIIGGTANNRGVILGAAIYWGFQKGTATLASRYFPAAVSAKISALRVALIGALFIAIIYYRPGGIWKEQPVSMEEVE